MTSNIKALLIVLVIVTFSGCSKPMTNEDIIAETKKCKEAGLQPTPVYNYVYTRIHTIVCKP